MARKAITRLPIGPSEREQIRNIRFDISRGLVFGHYPGPAAPVQPAGPTGIVFQNFPRVLPATNPGETYYEYQIGRARPNDPRPRGRNRLVVLVRGATPLRVFFTDAHYERGSFVEIE